MTPPSRGLEVRDVRVRAGARTLLDGVSFEAAPGEVVAILGPNGAGKTTLLDAVTGIRRADGGTVLLGGLPLRHFGQRARCFAFLPEQGALPAELRVRDVLRHSLRFGARPPEIVGDLRGALGIDRLEDASVGVLSRGEHQRVALFCALAIDRPAVVLDEPFGAFDPLQLRDVLGAVRRVAESGAAVVATIHHLADAARIADRLLILADGRALAWGDLASLRGTAGNPGASLEDVFVALLSGREHGA